MYATEIKIDDPEDGLHYYISSDLFNLQYWFQPQNLQIDWALVHMRPSCAWYHLEPEFVQEIGAGTSISSHLKHQMTEKILRRKIDT